MAWDNVRFLPDQSDPKHQWLCPYHGAPIGDDLKCWWCRFDREVYKASFWFFCGALFVLAFDVYWSMTK